MAIQTIIRSTRGAGALDRPRTTHRQDLVTVLLATWLIGGIGLDGWAHSNLERQTESFFTPWHAVFYSGFVATALWVLWLVQTRRADHVAWTQAVPRGTASAWSGWQCSPWAGSVTCCGTRSSGSKPASPRC